jgi:nitroreductase
VAVDTGPDEASLRRAVASAVRAPSVYNCQPWRWRVSTRDGVDLFADRDRRLIVIDPQGRDLLLSCGAALNHLEVALAGQGLSAEITRLPDPENSDHLARVRPTTAPPPASTAGLAAAIPQRRTDRRRFSADPVAATLLDALVEHATTWGAELHVVAAGAPRRHLIETISTSASLQRQQAGYAAELAKWTGRYSAAGDGIESSTVVSGIGRPGEVPMRPFGRGHLAQPAHSFEHDDASVLMVLGTAGDDRLSVLRAGEAASAVLLAATSFGLATTPLSQPLEVVQTRQWITTHVTGPQRFAQLVLRVGWPDPDAPRLPPTSRRRLKHVLPPS